MDEKEARKAVEQVINPAKQSRIDKLTDLSNWVYPIASIPLDTLDFLGLELPNLAYQGASYLTTGKAQNFPGYETLNTYTTAAQDWIKEKTGATLDTNDTADLIQYLATQAITPSGFANAGVKGAKALVEFALPGTKYGGGVLPTLGRMAGNVGVQSGMVLGVDALPDNYENTVVAGATLAIAAGIGGRVLYNYAKGKRLRTKLQQNSEFSTGPKQYEPEVVRSNTTTYDSSVKGFVSQLTDEQAPLKKELDRIGAHEAKTRLNLGKLTAAGRRADFFLQTGEFPDSSIKTISPELILRKAMKLTPEQHGLLNDAIIAATRMDDLIYQNKNVWGQYNATDLRVKIDAAKADPQVAEVMNDIRKVMHNVLEFKYEQGLLSQHEYIRQKNARPNYFPLQQEFAKRWVKVLEDYAKGRLGNQTNIEFRNSARAMLESGEELKPGSINPPIFEFENYLVDVAIGAIKNRVVRDVAKALNGRNLPQGGVKIVASGHPLAKDPMAVEFWSDGKKKFLYIPDPAIASVLRFSPVSTIPIMAAAARIYQNMTTGIPAIYKLPALLGYEISAAMNFTPKGRRLGVIDDALKYTPLKLGNADVSVVLSPVVGTLRGYLPNLMRQVGQNLRVAASRNEGLAKYIGKTAADEIGKQLEIAYANSTIGLMTKFGVGRAHWKYLNQNDVVTDILNDVPEYAAAKGAFPGTSSTNQLSLLYDMTHLSVRTQYFKSNLKRKLQVDENGRLPRIQLGKFSVPIVRWVPDVKSAEELMKLAEEARELTGDFGKIGGTSHTQAGSMYQKLITSTPYMNVSLQVLARMAEAFRENPQGFAIAFATKATIMAGLMAMAFDDPQAISTLDSMTPEQRGGMMMAFDENGKPIAAFVLSPEDALILGPLNEFFYQVFKSDKVSGGTLVKAFKELNGSDIWIAGANNVKKMNPFNMPILLDAAFKGFMAGRGMEGPGINEGIGAAIDQLVIGTPLGQGGFMPPSYETEHPNTGILTDGWIPMTAKFTEELFGLTGAMLYQMLSHVDAEINRAKQDNPFDPKPNVMNMVAGASREVGLKFRDVRNTLGVFDSDINITTVDSNVRYERAVMPIVEAIVQQFNSQVRNAGLDEDVTGVNDIGGMIPGMNVDQPWTDQMYIGRETWEMMRRLRPLLRERNELRERRDAIRTQLGANTEEIQKQLNEINLLIRAVNGRIVQEIKDTETDLTVDLRALLKDPNYSFKFRSHDPAALPRMF